MPRSGCRAALEDAESKCAVKPDQGVFPVISAFTSASPCIHLIATSDPAQRSLATVVPASTCPCVWSGTMRIQPRRAASPSLGHQLMPDRDQHAQMHCRYPDPQLARPCLLRRRRLPEGRVDPALDRRTLSGRTPPLESGTARSAHDAIVLLRLRRRAAAGRGALAAAQRPWPDHPAAPPQYRRSAFGSPVRAVGQPLAAGQRLRLASLWRCEQINPNVRPSLLLET